jgi:hypothetical protein
MKDVIVMVHEHVGLGVLSYPGQGTPLTDLPGDR